MARKFVGSSYKSGSMVNVQGVSKLLQKIEKAQGNVDEAVKKCAEESLAIIGKEAQKLMRPLSPGKAGSGDTYRSYEQTPAVLEDGKVKGMVGYDVNKGGLPAIFLDVGVSGTPKKQPKSASIGTPKKKPKKKQEGHFWRYYAVRNTQDQVRKVQKKTLQKILEDLK